MPSSITQFRARLYHDMTLPSGLTARIRKIQALDFLGLGELPIPAPVTEPSTSQTPQDLQLLKRYTDRALVRGVVEPPLTDGLDDGGRPVCGEERLHLSELLTEDYTALAQAILHWSGLTPEVAAEVETFRADPERPAGDRHGSGIPRAADRDIEVDAGGVIADDAAHLAV